MYVLRKIRAASNAEQSVDAGCASQMAFRYEVVGLSRTGRRIMNGMRNRT